MSAQTEEVGVCWGMMGELKRKSGCAGASRRFTQAARAKAKLR
jgi:hypothetical protein